MEQVIGGERFKRLFGVVAPSDRGHADAGLLCGLDVSCLVPDIEGLPGGESLAFENLFHLGSLAEELRGCPHEVKIGKIVPLQEGGDVALGVGGEDADAVTAGMKSGEDFGHSGDGIHRCDPLVQEFQTTLGDPGNAPVANAEVADELARAHRAGDLELLAGKGLEAEFDGEIIENPVRYIEGVGHRAVEVEEKKLRKTSG